ncbi:MAG TPA: hypothetical protein VJ183_10220 [Chloroflexia bacterium]|nr:hypothetical protein [Chloroflexia bacterium]
MHVLVDPVILTLPDNTATTESVVRFLWDLEHWSKEVHAKRHNFIISSRCVDAIYMSGLYPTVHNLAPLLRKAGIEDIDPTTVWLACQSILVNEPHFEDRAKLADVAVYPDRVSVDPDLVRRLPSPVADALGETLGLVAYAREVAKPAIISDMVMATQPIERGNIINVDALIATNEGDLQVVTDCPAVLTPDDLMRMMRLQDIWSDTEQALEWALQQLIHARQLPKGKYLKMPIVAPEFNESIRKAQFDTHPDLLAALFYTVVRLVTEVIPHRPTKTHKPYKGVKCNSVDAAGREWEPWHIWVTRGGPAVRLNYWWHEGEYILSRAFAHDDDAFGPVPR